MSYSMKGGKPGRPPSPSLPGEEGEREPRPGPTMLKKPEWLVGYAAVIWRRSVRELEDMGIAHAADRDSLAAYCAAVAFMRQAIEIVDRSNVLSHSKLADGRVQLRGNPAGREFERYARMVRGIAQEFGFSPSARTRIETGESQGADPLEGADRQAVERLIEDAQAHMEAS